MPAVVARYEALYEQLGSNLKREIQPLVRRA